MFIVYHAFYAIPNHSQALILVATLIVNKIRDKRKAASHDNIPRAVS